MTIKDLREQLLGYPDDMQVFLNTDEVTLSKFSTTILEIPKSNSDGTYEACVIYSLSDTGFEI